MRKIAVLSEKECLPISVIVPCFNNGHFITQCVESINSNSIPDEIIVIDDNSTDNSIGVVEELCENYSNIILIKKEVNGGAAAARLSGIKSAKNPWIALVDADDYVEKGSLDDAYNKALQQNADICVWTMWRFNSEKQWPQISFAKEEFPKTGRQAVIATLGCWKIHPLGVAKKELYLQAYDSFSSPEGSVMNADELITRLVFEKSKKVIFSDYRYFYRVNENSTTLKRSVKHLSTLRSDVWLLDFVQQYEEVPPGKVAKGIIGKSWRFHLDRRYYGADAVKEEIKYALAAMRKLAPPKRWLWRYPKHCIAYIYLLSIYSRSSSPGRDSFCDEK
jgi:glycosyltransferase involved in cell wall biosynthesis